MRSYLAVENRIEIFTSLPLDSLDRLGLESHARATGMVRGPQNR